MTLIELIVAMAIGSVVMALLSSMMVSVYGTQDRVSQSSTLISESQTSSEIFRAAIRSSTGGKLSNVTVSSKTGQLLVTRTLDNTKTFTWTPTAKCIAFLWHPDGYLLWATATSSAQLPASNSLQGWVELASPIEPLGVDGTVFSKNGLEYRMRFVTKPSAGPEATIQVSVLAPNVDTEVSGGCY
jgi:prepilin-type N-terminal cleavage/methylation domain-containing protein